MGDKIGIVIPTRGLIFTRVLEAIERERQGHEVKVYYSHDLPIPDGHNQLAKQALDDGCDWIWMVEEDTIPPKEALDKLLAANADIACIDYGVAGWGCVTRNGQGEILWCGLGTTLIKRQVFEAIEYPYFRADKQLRLNDWKWIDAPKDSYGSLDIWFSCQAREKGFKIMQVEGECDHLKLNALGAREVNHGLHQISLKPKIEKHQIL